MQKENGDHNLKIKNTFNLKGISNFIMDLENYFTNGKVYIWEETFAIIKAKRPYLNAFVNIIDKNEKNWSHFGERKRLSKGWKEA